MMPAVVPLNRLSESWDVDFLIFLSFLCITHYIIIIIFTSTGLTGGDKFKSGPTPAF
jgi:hypothetical protein